MGGLWTPLSNAPRINASTMLLLTDGSIICQGIQTKDWWKLVPDAYGDYIDGTWVQIASAPNNPLYYASAVLRDGRVFTAGGEYSSSGPDLLAAQIYDPVANAWTVLPTPAGWKGIGDAPCCVLPDGRVLLGSIFNNQTAIYDPVTNTWSPAANKLNGSSTEETWTLLPDGSVLSCNCADHPKTQKYVPAANQWCPAGATPIDLVEASSIEIGPAILLPDGRTFCIGATGATALYTMPPIANQPGTWTLGPSFPSPSAGVTLGAKDAPAALLPNGRVLCVAGPVGPTLGYSGPMYFFEFDPATSAFSAVAAPPTSNGPPFIGRMLLTPTGQVLFTVGSNNVQVYTPDGTYDEDWQPEITSSPQFVSPHFTYILRGMQLNGLSQAVSYGDDATMATNYPIVKIRSKSTNHVFYCKTMNHSTMGVATGSVIHSTQFQVPVAMDFGPAELYVIANGIPSDPVQITVGPFRFGVVDEGLIVREELVATGADRGTAATEAQLQQQVDELARRTAALEMSRAQQQSGVADKGAAIASQQDEGAGVRPRSGKELALARVGEGENGTAGTPPPPSS